MGAPSGMKTVALMPSACAARATPWAWLPADAATTPRAFSSSERRDIRVYAPRTLKDPVRWRFSHLRKTGLPVSAESHRDPSIGVRRARGLIVSAACSMSSIETWTTSVILPGPVVAVAGARLVELVGNAGVVGVTDPPVLVVIGVARGVDGLPGVLIVLLQGLLGVFPDPGVLGEVLDDGVRSRSEGHGDQGPGDAGDQDAGRDCDDDAERMDRHEAAHQERLQHVALDLLHRDDAAEHHQGDHDALVDERHEHRHRAGH